MSQASADPGLDRPERCLDPSGNFAVRIAQNIGQQHGRTFGVVESVEAAAEIARTVEAIIGLGDDVAVLKAFHDLGLGWNFPAVVAQHRQTSIAQDCVEPALRSPTSLVELTGTLPDYHKAVLHRVFGQIQAPQHPLRHTQHPPAFGFHDGSERGRVAARTGLDQLCVVRHPKLPTETTASHRRRARADHIAAIEQNASGRTRQFFKTRPRTSAHQGTLVRAGGPRVRAGGPRMTRPARDMAYAL